MPKTATNAKYYSKKYSEDVLQKALEAVTNGMPKKQASKIYGIPRSTIQNRLSGKFRKISLGPAPILTNEEELIIVDWVLRCHRKGFPRRKENIQSAVKEFLQKQPRPNPFRDNKPGEKWYKCFLHRHPTLVERTPEAVTAASARVSESDIKNWFKTVEKYLKDHDLLHVITLSESV